MTSINFYSELSFYKVKLVCTAISDLKYGSLSKFNMFSRSKLSAALICIIKVIGNWMGIQILIRELN